jgi:hypothetical protein
VLEQLNGLHSARCDGYLTSRGLDLRRTLAVQFPRSHLTIDFHKREEKMEIVIELSEAELKEVAGGSGSASLTFWNSASGTTASVTGTLNQATTASSASQSGFFTSSSR